MFIARIAAPLLALALASPACAEPHEAAHGPDEASEPTTAGKLQGNWRVTRADDPDEQAIMALHIIHDGDRLEGSYLLLQPFCGVELPLPRPLDETCEFAGLALDFETGFVDGGDAIVLLRPGADLADHRLAFDAEADAEPVTGKYWPPAGQAPVDILLERAPE